MILGDNDSIYAIRCDRDFQVCLSFALPHNRVKKFLEIKININNKQGLLDFDINIRS